jgi:hypothetical protein
MRQSLSSSGLSHPSGLPSPQHNLHPEILVSPFQSDRRTSRSYTQNKVEEQQHTFTQRPGQHNNRRRTNSEPVFTINAGEDVLRTPRGRVRKALKGLKVHGCHCGKVCTPLLLLDGTPLTHYFRSTLEQNISGTPTYPHHYKHISTVFPLTLVFRRHQLSHEGPSFTCERPGCEKSFNRPDLFDRHMKAQSVMRISKLLPVLTLPATIPLPQTQHQYLISTWPLFPLLRTSPASTPLTS